jgi:predicted ATP-dependent protease
MRGMNNASPLANSLRIKTSDLRWICDPGALGFASTAELNAEGEVVGQDDALEALRFGLETFAPGQNVFVRGLTGTGRLGLVQRVLADIQPACALGTDFCYVTNFDRPDEPSLLKLQRGKGTEFRDALAQLVEFLKNELEPALQSDLMRTRRRHIEKRFEKEGKAVSDPFEKELNQEGLSMIAIKVGDGMRQALVPMIDGEPAPPERLAELQSEGLVSAEQVGKLEGSLRSWSGKLEALSLKVRGLGQSASAALRQLYRAEIETLIEAELVALRKNFPEPAVGRYLDGIIKQVQNSGVKALQTEHGARVFSVNVVSGHGPQDGCPMLVESTPSVSQLLGAVDRRVLSDGNAVSDHLMISAGSLLRANGGYLIIEARDILREPGAWKVLLRTLRSGLLEIVPPEIAGPWGSIRLRPEPIPIQVKVILIGDPGMYNALDSKDPDFPHLFKVLADFDSSIDVGSEGLRGYGAVFAKLAKDESLLAFSASGVAALAEHGARIAGRNTRLTTRFGRLSDIAREGCYLARKAGDRETTGEHVLQAVVRNKRRGDLPARKFRKRVADGTIHVMTQGACVGQVNGLAVIHAGALNYGFPARITATIGAGNAGVINIERESQLSGQIHTKGFHIVRGLMRHLIKAQHPLAFSASIAFEQSYGGIDGDSASGAETCCLLSALSDLPLRQDLAMTGAVDQHGRILPIGAANEKIEGFYDACRDVGLTGSQGVLIPSTNVGDLMLRHDVVQACERGEFHVYGVSTIQEALELFTGVPIGERQADDEFPEGSVMQRAVQRAFEFWALAVSAPTWEDDDGEDDSDAKDKAVDASS